MGIDPVVAGLYLCGLENVVGGDSEDVRYRITMTEMTTIPRKTILVTAIVLLSVAAIALAWCRWAGRTRIAIVNYNVITQMQMSRANDNPSIVITNIAPEELRRLRRCDMVLINGMGLKLTEARRAGLLGISESVPVLTVMATNPANEIVSLDSTLAGPVYAYLGNGGEKNYRNLFLYIRRHIDGKLLRAPEPDPASEIAEGLLYTPGEDREFFSVREYRQYLESAGKPSGDAGRIVLTGRMGSPAPLAEALEAKGYEVYCVRDFRKLAEGGHIDSIAPSAVINMAHGRLGDYAVDYFQRTGIPYFAPLNVNVLRKEWEQDRKGMTGGFITLGISAVACVLCLVWFMRSKTLDRVSLKTDITGSVDRTAEQSVKVGDTGVTTTRLALVGHADIAGHLVEVNSADGFLDEKTPVIVTRITNGTIFVRKQ